MNEIPLTQGKFTVVDDEDYEWLMQWKWFAVKAGKTYYARRASYKNGRLSPIPMHREILGLLYGDGTLGDHRNRNGLDNRRNNLRVASAQLNCYNKGMQKNNTSGFRGVTWDKRSEQWLAQIRVDRKTKGLGYYPIKKDAAIAYDNAAIKYFGTDAILNIPNNIDNNATREYTHARDLQIQKNLNDAHLTEAAKDFTSYIVKNNYIKNFSWAGRPMMQYAGDMMVLQELIWKIRPDWVIETGVAFGGSLAFYASIFSAIGRGEVLGIDIEIKEHNRSEMDMLPDAIKKRFCIKIGSSIDPGVFNVVKMLTENRTVLVVLDSSHSHAHVLQELKLYAPLVSVGSYIIIMDTAIQFYGHLDKNKDRPWGKNSNPYTATTEFLESEMGSNFIVDSEVEMRALITSAPGGWLRRVK